MHDHGRGEWVGASFLPNLFKLVLQFAVRGNEEAQSLNLFSVGNVLTQYKQHYTDPGALNEISEVEAQCKTCVCDPAVPSHE